MLDERGVFVKAQPPLKSLYEASMFRMPNAVKPKRSVPREESRAIYKVDLNPFDPLVCDQLL